METGVRAIGPVFDHTVASLKSRGKKDPAAKKTKKKRKAFKDGNRRLNRIEIDGRRRFFFFF